MHDLVIHYRKDDKYKNYLIKDGRFVDEEDLTFIASKILKFMRLGGFNEKK